MKQREVLSPAPNFCRLQIPSRDSGTTLEHSGKLLIFLSRVFFVARQKERDMSEPERGHEHGGAQETQALLERLVAGLSRQEERHAVEMAALRETHADLQVEFRAWRLEHEAQLLRQGEQEEPRGQAVLLGQREAWDTGEQPGQQPSEPESDRAPRGEEPRPGGPGSRANEVHATHARTAPKQPADQSDGEEGTEGSDESSEDTASSAGTHTKQGRGEDRVASAMEVIAQTTRAIQAGLEKTHGVGKHAREPHDDDEDSEGPLTTPDFQAAIPNRKHVLDDKKLGRMMRKPLGIEQTDKYVARVLKRGDKWELPEAWDLATTQLQLQKDIGKSKPLLSHEALNFLLRTHKTLLMLSGEIEKGAVANDKPLFYAALDDVRVLLGAMESRVTHDMFQRAWCEEDTRKKRDTSQALTDMDKLGPHFKSLLRKDMVKTASFVSSSFGLGKSNAGGGSNGRQRGSNGNSPSKHKFSPRKQNKGAQRFFDANSGPGGGGDAHQPAAAGWNPNFKGRPENFIPGFVRKSDGKQGSDVKKQ